MQMDQQAKEREWLNFMGVAAAFEKDRRHGLWVPPEDAGEGWVRIKLPPEPMFKYAASFQKGVRDGFLSVMVEHRRRKEERIVFPKGRWHLSIAHNSHTPIMPGMQRPGRMPTWEEVKVARYKFLPDGLNMAIMFPPEAMYYNRHATCIHLLEIPLSLALDAAKQGGL